MVDLGYYSDYCYLFLKTRIDFWGMQELTLWVAKRQIDPSNIYSLESHIQIKSVKNAHFFKIIGSSTQTTGSMLFLLNYQLLWPMSAKIMNSQRPLIFITLFAKWNLLPTKLLHAAGLEQKAYRKCTIFFAFSWFLVNLPLSLSANDPSWRDELINVFHTIPGKGVGVWQICLSISRFNFSH